MMQPDHVASPLRRIMRFLIEAAQKKKHLTLTIKMQAGQIGILRVEETFLPEHLPVTEAVGVQQVEPG